MPYQRISWGPFTCPAFQTQYPSSPFGVDNVNILSVGFQNLGLAQQFYASQAFVASNTTMFVQVVNTSGSSTQWYAWAVCDTGPSSNVDAEMLKAPEPEMETHPL
jgi:hypothetical protein